MDEYLSYFSVSYSDARGRFLAACHDHGAAVTQLQNPVTGPDGELLATDVARIGPENPARVLIAVSATHGAEGFCGSGLQVGLLAGSEPVALPPDTARLFSNL